MEKFLVEIVFPEFASPHGHLRYSNMEHPAQKPMYKEQMGKFLVEIVIPEFASPHGHLRYSNMEHPAQETHVQGADGEVPC